MNRKKVTVDRSDNLLEKVKTWISAFDTYCVFNPIDTAMPYGSFPTLMAAGSIEDFLGAEADPFGELLKFIRKDPDQLFGYFSYDLKNYIANLNSENIDRIKFPDIFFFRPAHIFRVHKDSVEIETVEDPQKILNEINQTKIPDINNIISISTLKSRTSKSDYIKIVKDLKQRIVEGDFYEINYCIQFIAEINNCNPMRLFEIISRGSPGPFATIFRYHQNYLISTSPERFLKKLGNKLVTQPMKGTIKRGITEEQDSLLRNQLLNDEKERSENLMIVDLVRNDLAKSSIAGSIQVEELFGIYSFKHWSQMVSTVSGTLSPKIEFTNAIKNAFPIGSMTGAPKIRVMETIEKYENFKRNLYSGAIGYIDKSEDFDFSVVIRSLLINMKENILTLPVGSAITYDSDPDKEYSECLLKVKGITRLISNHTKKS